MPCNMSSTDDDSQANVSDHKLYTSEELASIMAFKQNRLL